MRTRRTIPLEQREKILAAYDKGTATRAGIARKFRISEGMVKKLLQQRRNEGDIAPRHHLAGRKPQILEKHQNKMRTLLAKKPHLTLAELRDSVGLDCTVQAIHAALSRMGLSTKRKRTQPAKKVTSVSPARTKPAKGAKGKSKSAAKAKVSSKSKTKSKSKARK